MRGAFLLGVVVAVAAGAASAGEPTANEQLMLEMTNRMRWDPAAELHVLTNINPGPPATWRTPRSNDADVASALTFFNVDANALATQWAALTPRVAPLAWNGALHNAAAAHNAEMIRYDQQSHQLPSEPGLGPRLVNAGYAYTNAAENVYAYSESVFYGHAGFAIDWGNGPGGIQSPPGHRNTIMNANLREVGISITPENNPATAVGPLVITQDFGRRSGNAFITGVAYDDAVAPDYFYTPGEGLGGVTVQALTPGTSTVRGSTTTFASGGYTLQLAPGTYDVRLSGGAFGNRVVTYRDVQLGSSNVKIDNLTSFIAAPGAAWNAVQNWSAGVPNGPGTQAVLGRTIPGQAAGPRSVNVSSQVTVGQLVLDNDNPVTLSGSGPLTLAGGGTARAHVQVRRPPGGAPHAITAPISFTGEVVRDGAGTLTISGQQQHAPGALLTVTDGRTDIATNAGGPNSRPLAIAASGATTAVNFQFSQDLRRLDVTGGARVALTPNGGRILVTEALLTDGGTFDLTDNAVLVDYNSASDPARAGVPEAIRRAFAGGTWVGTGITSSTAAAKHNGAVGYAESTDVFDFRPDVVRTFFGRVVDETAVLVRYTLEGDADLDGAVTSADFRRLREGLASAGEWSDGDFDYDGRVTARDYAMLRTNFGRSVAGTTAVSAADWAALEAFAAVVPEPSAAALLALAGVTGLRRRRAA